jgi:hypothetical protein
MPRVMEMLESYPMRWNGFDRAKFAECIEACFRLRAGLHGMRGRVPR